MLSLQQAQFEGPRGRYFRALFELKHSEAPVSDDIWVDKLKRWMRQRQAYKDMAVLYAEEQPLQSKLFEIYENDEPGSFKHVLEAALCTPEPFTVLERLFVFMPGMTHTLIAAYHEMFFTIRDFIHNPMLAHQYLIKPITSLNTNKLGYEHIWKLLAYTGGLKALIDKGFGAKPLESRDFQHILQQASYRSISTLMVYNAKGADVTGEDDNVMRLASYAMQAIVDSNNSKTDDRNAFGFKAVDIQALSNYSEMLADCVSMRRKVREDCTEAELRLDGTFNPGNTAAVEKCQPAALTF